MATVERPEIEIVEGEVPAVAVEVAEAGRTIPESLGTYGSSGNPVGSRERSGSKHGGPYRDWAFGG